MRVSSSDSCWNSAGPAAAADDELAALAEPPGVLAQRPGPAHDGRRRRASRRPARRPRRPAATTSTTWKSWLDRNIARAVPTTPATTAATATSATAGGQPPQRACAAASQPTSEADDPDGAGPGGGDRARWRSGRSCGRPVAAAPSGSRRPTRSRAGRACVGSSSTFSRSRRTCTVTVDWSPNDQPHTSLEQLVAGEGVPRVGDQEAQQVELARRSARRSRPPRVATCRAGSTTRSPSTQRRRGGRRPARRPGAAPSRPAAPARAG